MKRKVLDRDRDPFKVVMFLVVVFFLLVGVLLISGLDAIGI
ncbi:MAG: hypothetical protein ABSA65_06630 [Acidimicrobiales bacterium]